MGESKHQTISMKWTIPCSVAVVAFLVLPWIGTAAPVDLGDPGLAGCWTFEEGAGDIARDRSDNNHNGTLKNGPVWVGDGIGSAIQLDGKAAHIDCGNSPMLDITEKISLEAWVYPAEWPIGEPLIVGKGTDAYALTCYSDGRVYLYISGGGNKCYAAVPLRKWTHVVGTYDGQKMQLFVDGEMEGYQTLIGEGAQPNRHPVPIRSSGENVLIGRMGNSYFPGKLDEVRIYRKVLSEKEIKARFRADQERLKQAATAPIATLKGIARKVAELGTNRAPLIVTAAEVVESDLTIPPNIGLKFEMGGFLQVSEGAVLLIQGPVEALLTQIFQGKGRVVIDSGCLKEIYPQWWGATANDKTDDTSAIQSALFAYPKGGRIFFPAGTYRVSATLKIPSRTSVEGGPATLQGPVGVMFQPPDPRVRSSSWRMRGLHLDGVDRVSSAIGIDFTKNSYSIIEDVAVTGFGKGIFMDGGDEACMYNTLRNLQIARCDTAIELNNSTIATLVSKTIIGAVRTGILVNTANALDLFSVSIEVFDVGVEVRRGDTVNMNYLYLAGGKIGIQINEGVSECTVLNPRYSQVTTELIDKAKDTLVLDTALSKKPGVPPPVGPAQ